MNIKRLVSLLLLLFSIQFSVLAQSVDVNSINSMNLDQVSDAELIKFVEEAKSKGLDENAIISAAQAKGVNASQIEKLRLRLNGLGTKSTNSVNTFDVERYKQVVDVSKREISQGSQVSNEIFGADLFNNSNLTFEPNLRIPTPKNYTLGPDDELVIDIYGYSQANYRERVSVEGYINISNVGLLYVNGLTIEQATQKIKARLSEIYSGILGDVPTTYCQVSLGNIRTIKVTLLGAIVKPGTYSVSSLSTLFNALYLSGGPNENGSFRNIELIRNNKTFLVLDLYDFLLKADQSKNVRLMDQDVIKVNTYDVRVKISGQVKSPKLFEVKKGETLKDILNYAGGFTDNAFRDRIKAVGKNERQLRIFTIAGDSLAKYIPKAGDEYFVESILTQFENRVSITGAIYRPGDYELKKGYTLKQLIEEAGSTTPDAFLDRVLITRQQPNLELENIAINLKDLLNGASPDVELKKEDLVKVESIFNLREQYKVSILGLVNKPGDFGFVENMNLEDLILNAGGFKEAGSNLKIEVSRRYVDPNPLSPSGQLAEVFNFDINRDLKNTSITKDFYLKPFDIVFVRISPGYEVQQNVRLIGEVIFPGDYTIRDKEERLSELIQRAGGLSNRAYPKGARLLRKLPFSSKEIQSRNLYYNKYKKSIGDSTNVDALIYDDNLVGLDLDKAIKNPGSRFDLILRPGDEITIPQEIQTVEAVGQVIFPLTVRYQKFKGLRYYIRSAGGFTDNALKRKTFVLYANGKIKKTRKFIFNFYPRIEQGCQIVVPNKPKDRKNTVAENIAITTGISSITLVFVNIINLLK